MTAPSFDSATPDSADEAALFERLVARMRTLAPTEAVVRGALRTWDNLVGTRTVAAETRARRLALLPRTYQALLTADPTAILARSADDSPLDRILGSIECSRRGDLQGAAALLRPALAQVDQRVDAELRVAVGITLAPIVGSLGDLPAAATVLAETLELSRRTGNHLGEQTTLANLGYLYGQEGSATPYASYTRQALVIARELGEPRFVAHGLNNLAGALVTLGQLDEASEMYGECLRTVREVEWPTGEAFALGGLAGIALARGDADAGTTLYEQSNEILRSLGDHYQLVRHDFLLGTHLVRLELFERAIGPLTSAIEGARARSYRSTLWQALAARSRARAARGATAEALADLEEHVALRAAADDEEITARVRLTNMRLDAEVASEEAGRERARAAELQALNDRLQASLAAQNALQAKLAEAARTDALTGLANRRHLQETLRMVPANVPLAVVLIDVDHFKSVNDRFGHAVGDAVLVSIARRLRAMVRTSDDVARWGGEEFCLTLRGVNGAQALESARRIVEGIANTPTETPVGPVSVTISAGVAALRDLTHDQLFHAADRALYRAKREGRNRAVAASTTDA